VQQHAAERGLLGKSSKRWAEAGIKLFLELVATRERSNEDDAAGRRVRAAQSSRLCKRCIGLSKLLRL
jgi:hypothetical protein